MRRFIVGIIGFLLAMILPMGQANACTNFLITKKATKDGCTMITYSADSHELYGELYFTPAMDHLPGTMVDVYEWDTGDYLGQIPQVPHTYSVVGNMNEHQVTIGETTFGGRKELQKGNGVIDYGSLMYITLQRAKTAREAIKVMTDLVSKYGYYSSGESFSIGDPNEVWLLEMISKGKDEMGAVWVARRVPDGYISGHANQARITTFPLDDPDNCLYAPDLIEFARKNGWFQGEDKDFSFADVYAPLDFGALRFCEARVYAGFRKAAPSKDLPVEFVMGDATAERLPLWIKPDKPLSVSDVMSMMRDHFEGTPMDMTKDVGAGPYCSPYRWRPLTWEVDSVRYFNERAISTQQTGFSFVAQMRSWLPDPIGGVLWFGVDDTYMTVYVPMYCGIRKAPYHFAEGTGNFDEFSWESAFWVFNFVSNYTYSRHKDMVVEVQKVQRELEGHFLAMQPSVEDAALALYKQSPELARDYLTTYSEKQANLTHNRWKKLGEYLIWKFLDGNYRDEHKRVKHPPYPESWYRTIIKNTGDKFKIPGQK
ncbi:MAG: C69 family dipeptidase [Calditrichia bacterium]